MTERSEQLLREVLENQRVMLEALNYMLRDRPRHDISSEKTEIAIGLAARHDLTKMLLKNENWYLHQTRNGVKSS